jgi:hypothetical protein
MLMITMCRSVQIHACIPGYKEQHEGQKMIVREYDLFEKDSGETVIWKCSVRGIIEAEERVSLLALLTNREVFAMFVDTKEIAGRADVVRDN